MRLSRSLLAASLAIVTGAASLTAQAAGEWVQPYTQAPGYWELIGRLIPDKPAVRRDRAFRGFLDPSVLVAGSIKPKTKPGEILGSFVRFQLVQEENVLNASLPPDRLVTADVTQVQAGYATADTIRMDVRTGNPSSEFQNCADARHQRFGHMVDVRVQATMMCEGAIFWTAWRTQTVQLEAGARGRLPLDHIGILVLAYDAKTQELTASVRVP